MDQYDPLSDLFMAPGHQIGIGLTGSPLMPVGWRVTNIEAIAPMAMSAGGHFLYPSESDAYRSCESHSTSVASL
jgi:hypothetical protein